MRNTTFAENEFYHIYNRGVDKRSIFPNIEDIERFLEGMNLFNNTNSIGSLSRLTTRYEHRDPAKNIPNEDRLVRVAVYCLNPNHFHLILEQVAEHGIERFMHKLGMGHSKYINAKYKRSGALFQGSFKAIHIDSNEYLLHVSAYVNLNDRVHNYRHGVSTRSSWKEYTTNNEGGPNFCKKDTILEQFKNKESYKKFAEDTLEDIVISKELGRQLEEEVIR